MLLHAEFANADSEEACPRTVGNAHLFSKPRPDSNNWYGTESLAVILDGSPWETTQTGKNFAFALFWYASGFEPGMETQLKVTVRNLRGGTSDAKVWRPTNAHVGGWAMQTAMDFPTPGCWEVTGEYGNAKLTFVLETVKGGARDT